MTLWTELKTERLHLRSLRDADEGPITLFAGDARVANPIGIPHPYPPGAAQIYIERARAQHVEMVWVLDGTPSARAEFIGIIGFRPEKQTIGYWIGPPFWGQGFGAEAASRVSDYLLGDGGVEALHATAAIDNVASQRVLTKAGFQRTGTAPRTVHSPGAAAQSVTYLKRAP